MNNKKESNTKKKDLDKKTQELLVLFANIIVDKIIEKYQLKGFKPNVVREG